MKKENAKELKPIYIIYGKEKLLLEEAVDRLKKRLSDTVDLTLNYEEFRGSETSIDVILGAANTPPFFSDKRLIVVKEADKLTASDVLIDYITKPPVFTHFILMATKIDKRSKLYKVANNEGYVYEYKSPNRGGMPKWVKERFLKKNKKVADEAINYLCLNLDNDLMRMQSEIEKICLYHEDKKLLNLDDIKPLIKKSSENSTFELVDLIGRRQEGKALAVLDNLIQSGEPISFLFHMILRQFRLLFKTKVLLEVRGISYSKLAQELRLPPFVVSNYREQSRNFTIEQLKRAHELFLEAEVDLKTSKKEPRLTLETLIARILN
ncbi:DNA polymerase III subunit delta [Candidatus Oleimmundimicrobium sp.]|uniref:DNA polymerase III subunit delta n=1 Tax=Candidatus Oleimmundimicrobium sp. TaxID=3060597 RepID=UPI002727D42A|nr:DNA polymerase III subunit delta [Candidatus Oleimmundimicrobium sp.]MDO8885856.1 DNA polymerase III subunit delta [Candidatus Oleimmundimicrobium sp.]